MFNKMYLYVTTILAINTGEQTVTWQYILLAYCHLEALALDLLRLHEGKDDQTYWASDAVRKKNLSSAANELSDKHLVPPDIMQILRNVANLRNSVAHKSVVGGMTTGQQVGERIIYISYKGTPVFDEFDDQGIMKSAINPEHSGVNEETVEQLTTDVGRAITELNRLRQETLKKQP
jgi:hypothetical protein